MYRNQLASKSLGLCLVLSLLATPLFAADLATVQMGSTGVSWQPAADAASWVLTVSGPDGYYVRQEFDSAPSMSLFTEDGQLLQDGLYKYELQAVPRVSSEIRQQLDAFAGDLDLRERLAARVEGLGGVQSGHFRISQGALVQDDQVELPASGGGAVTPLGDFAVGQTVPEGGLDHLQVINMDLLVNGSICVGFDCGSSQSFGADTLRLRENNLRIHFDDTSNSASFPSNDWRLIANDSTNGGANKFVIQDATSSREVFTIEAGSISNALYVDSGGDVGIGTSSPVVEVHAVDGNTPTLRLEQNGSSGFASQTWDVAGNETNFFVRDQTNGSKLPFRIKPNAPTDSLFVAADGDIGVGTASPSTDLHILRTNEAVADVQFKIETNTDPAFDFTDQGTGVTWRFINNGAQLRIADVGTGADAAEEFRLSQAGNIQIEGQIFTAGSCSGGCDLVFEPDYQVPSIEEHAAAMWENRHLPAVGPTPENGPFNLSKMTGGMLNELEKAHIYIEQLHVRLNEQEEENNSLAERLEALESLLHQAWNE